jgi:hypothetical protein
MLIGFGLLAGMDEGAPGTTQSVGGSITPAATVASEQGLAQTVSGSIAPTAAVTPLTSTVHTKSVSGSIRPASLFLRITRVEAVLRFVSAVQGVRSLYRREE